MAERLTPQTLDLEVWSSSLARREGTGDILLGGNPAMDSHPIQGGATMLLGLLFMLRKPA